MAAPAFGFSLGDFVAAIKLLDKAARALRETCGATSQFQQAATELKNIHDVLYAVQSLTASSRNTDIVQKIHVCALTCYIPLARFIDKLGKLEPYLGDETYRQRPTDLKQKLRTAGKKLQWAFTLEKDVLKLKQQIGPQLIAIGTMIQLDSFERTALYQHISQETALDTNQRTKDVLTSLEELKICVADRVETHRKGEIEHLRRLAVRMPISEYRSNSHHELTRLVRQTQSETSELHSRLGAIETMLGDLKKQSSRVSPLLATHSPPGMEFSQLEGRNNGPPSQGVTELESSEFVAATRFFAMILSIRQAAEQILFMLLLLLPAFRHVSRAVQGIKRGPPLLLEDNIHLEDALGRVLSLPYQHFRYWPVLFSRLQEAFDGLPGELRVKRNQFHIVAAGPTSNVIIPQKSYNQIVRPGSKLIMSMLYRNIDVIRNVCLQCQKPGLYPPNSDWIYCERCNVTSPVLKVQPSDFQWMKAIGVERDDVMDGIEPFWNRTPETIEEALTENTEMHTFKHLHVVVNSLNPEPRNEMIQVPTADGGLTSYLRRNRSYRGPASGGTWKSSSRRTVYNARVSADRFIPGIVEFKEERTEDHAPPPEAELPVMSATRDSDIDQPATRDHSLSPEARWTKIDRRLVNPEALAEAHEQFEEQLESVVVFRVLKKEELGKLVERTREIREFRIKDALNEW